MHRDPLIILVETKPGEQHAVIGCWRRGTPYTGALLRIEAYANRGNTYAELKRNKEALLDYERVIKMEPNSQHLAGVYFNAGIVALRRDLRSKALAYLERAAERGHQEAAKHAADLGQKIGLKSAADAPPAQVAYSEFLAVDTPEEMADTLDEFPIVGNTNLLAAIQEAAKATPAEFKQSVEERLKWVWDILARRALDGFQRAGSLAEMQRMVSRFPFLGVEFIEAVQQKLGLLEAAFEERLAWLRQIASEQ